MSSVPASALAAASVAGSCSAGVSAGTGDFLSLATDNSCIISGVAPPAAESGAALFSSASDSAAASASAIGSGSAGFGAGTGDSSSLAIGIFCIISGDAPPTAESGAAPAFSSVTYSPLAKASSSGSIRRSESLADVTTTFPVVDTKMV